MMLSVLLLLLLVSTTQAGFYGYVFTYTTKAFQGGRLTGISHATVAFSSCQEADAGYCGGSCDQIDENSGEWCQKERIWNWSDTVSLHLLEVPSNCQRNINLLTFDPDGDEVKCRYANGSLSECNDCTPPSVLNLSSSCTLSFSPTSCDNEGPYAVQLMMEEFPRQTMILTDFSGVEVVRTTSDLIGKTPLQFVLNVDPAAPSCTEGLYLPRFLPPTPENGAEIFITINQMVEIPVRAEANQSEITELLFSGPHDVLKNSSGPGNFTLSWTAADNFFNEGQSLPICFIVQSNLSGAVFQSELRCVVVTVKNGLATTAVSLLPTSAPLTTASQTPMIMQSISTLPPTTMAPPTTTPAPPTTSINMSPNSTSPPGPSYIIALKMKISTTLSLSSDKDTIIKLIKDEFIRRGLTSDITIRLLSDGSAQVTTSTPGG